MDCVARDNESQAGGVYSLTQWDGKACQTALDDVSHRDLPQEQRPASGAETCIRSRQCPSELYYAKI